MAKDEPKTETTSTATPTGAAQRRVRMDTSNLKSAYCNFFVAQDNPNEVLLNFGFNQSPGSTQADMQVQLLQQVILHPATARQVKDALVTLFNRRDARRSRPAAASVAPKKAS